MTYERVMDWAGDMVKTGTRHIESFKDNLKTNPVHAFTWAQGAIKGAAMLECGAYLQNWADMARDKGLDLEVVARGMVEHAISETLRMATSDSFSTSQASNLMERYKLVVWADLSRKAFDAARYDDYVKDEDRIVGFGTVHSSVRK